MFQHYVQMFEIARRQQDEQEVWSGFLHSIPRKGDYIIDRSGGFRPVVQVIWLLDSQESVKIYCGRVDA